MDLLSVVSSGIKLPNAQSIGVVLVLHAVSVLLTLIVPGPPFKGSPLKNNRPSIIYKMNGLRVQLLAILLFIACSNWGLGLYDISIIYNNYGAVLTTTVIYSFIFSTVLFVRAKYWIPKEERDYVSDNPIVNYWCGIELNPHFFGFEIKFWSYRPGFILMSLISISVLFKQYEKYGTFSVPMLLFQAINLFYVTDAFWFESGMTYMFDIIEENFGLMLVFGDYVWIPFVFSLQSLYLVDSFNISYPYIALNLVILAVGYNIFRSSNYQKLQFRLDPKKPIEGKPPQVVKTGRPGRDLLISGWWGRARKINYTGDILIAIAMSMPCDLYLLAYLYPIYLTILLINRAKRDDERCREKYKECWTEYCKKVPYVMIPGIY